MKPSPFALTALAFLGVPTLPPDAAADPVAALPSESPYFVVLESGAGEGESEPLPLKATDVRVGIAGIIAEVEVRQHYRNTGSKTLEAVYVFPGSTRAAVHGLDLEIGGRRLAARIAEKEAARRQYEQAKAGHRTAALLEQERPNVFRMNVGHILPGDEVFVTLRYTERIEPVDRVYEFLFPGVVGPRYGNGASSSDTSWSANPHLKPGAAAPAAFSLRVDLAAGLPVKEASSPTHALSIEYPGGDRLRARLKPEETRAGDRDFVFRYRLAGERLESGLLLHEDARTGENHFLLLVQPPARVRPEEIPPRDYVFVVDVSGSMAGFPLDTAKGLLRDLIGGLRPEDRFNVLLFAGDSSLLSEASLPATREYLDRATAFIDRERGGGGTELGRALERALAQPKEAGVSRSIVLVTDGHVNFEREVFGLVRDRLGEGNLFPLGIGSSVNRFLIEGLARAGRGEPFIVLGPAEAPAAAGRLREMIASPVLTRVGLDFGGDFEVHEVSPAGYPDVFADRPLAVFGKYRGRPAGEVRVTGLTGGGREVSLVVPMEGKSGGAAANPALPLLWARQRIAERSDDYALSKKDEARAEVTNLGLTHGLLTEFTSFVAVDPVARDPGPGQGAETVRQPLPLPQGMPASAVGGGTIPEPGSILLWLTGMVTLLWRRLFGRKAAPAA